MESYDINEFLNNSYSLYISKVEKRVLKPFSLNRLNPFIKPFAQENNTGKFRDGMRIYILWPL